MPDLNYNHPNYIRMDLAKFKKTTKELHYTVNEKYRELNSTELNQTNLSQIQELFSRSLGFRNYDAIIKHYSEHKHPTPSFKTGRFLDDWKSEEIISLISFLMESYPNDIWKSKGMALFTAIINTLCHMRDELEILLDSEVIREYLIFDNIFKLYKTRRDFPNQLRSALRAYLFSLPGFQESAPKQSDSVYSYHAQLQMIFNSVLTIIKNIEICNPIIISPNWYQANYSYCKNINNLSHIEQTDNNDNRLNNTIKTSNRLNDLNIDDYYKKYDTEDWTNLFKNNKSIIIKNDKNESVSFNGFSLIKPIINSSYLEDSWLDDITFKNVLNNIIANKQFKTFYLSDLLIHSFKIINKQKRLMYNECVNTLVTNYSSVIEYSEKINDLTK
jgi:hypothetical protein